KSEYPETITPGIEMTESGSIRGDGSGGSGIPGWNPVKWLIVTLTGIGIGWGWTVTLGATAENPPQAHYFMMFALTVALTTPLLIPMTPRWRSGGSFLMVLIPATGICAMLVNFLAAGGFGMPAMASVFWVLVATLLTGLRRAELVGDMRNRETMADMVGSTVTDLAAGADIGVNSGTNGTSERWSRRDRYGRWKLSGLTVVIVLILVATVRVGWLPWLTMNARLSMADRPGRDIDEVVKICESAAALDPLSERPRIRLAVEAHRSLCAMSPRSPGLVERRKLWERTVADVRRLEPFASHNDRLFASQAMELALAPAYRNDPTQVTELRRLAVRWYARAVGLYPTLASLRAEYAESLELVGELTEASWEWAEALRLDEVTPHMDKKLSPEQRERAEQRARGGE
ncbi:MAG: hypothetical protein Q4C47_07915, partial [Planctomycetia bacterium]|nr:hypothetical protein [Planctomycetia bacterium]